MPWKPVPGQIRIVNQRIPTDFADLLVGLYVTGRLRKDPNYALLNATLAEANRKGWTSTSLAEPLGVTRERVRQRVTATGTNPLPVDDLPDIPDPPRFAEPPPGPVQPDITDGMAAWLRHMSDTARTVNGITPLDDPARGVSEAYTAVLADLYDRGVPARRLADAVGVTKGAIVFRLRRHGYRHSAPSQPVYRRILGGFPRRQPATDALSPGERYEQWLKQQVQL